MICTLVAGYLCPCVIVGCTLLLLIRQVIYLLNKNYICQFLMTWTDVKEVKGASLTVCICWYYSFTVITKNKVTVSSSKCSQCFLVVVNSTTCRSQGVYIVLLWRFYESLQIFSCKLRMTFYSLKMLLPRFVYFNIVKLLLEVMNYKYYCLSCVFCDMYCWVVKKRSKENLFLFNS